MEKIAKLFFMYLGFVSALTLTLSVVFSGKPRPTSTGSFYSNRESSRIAGDINRNKQPKTPKKRTRTTYRKPAAPVVRPATSLEDIPKSQKIRIVKKKPKPRPKRKIAKAPAKPPKKLNKRKPKKRPIYNSKTVGYAVEIQIFRRRDRAEALASVLMDNSVKAYVVFDRLNGQKVFRVRQGRFDTEEEALASSRALHKRTKIAGRVVALKRM